MENNEGNLLVYKGTEPPIKEAIWIDMSTNPPQLMIYNYENSSWISWLESAQIIFSDVTVTYDGKYHTIEVSELPEGLSVSYLVNGQILTQDNTPLNAGEYIFTAVFISDGSVPTPANKTATLVINEADIDLSSFTWIPISAIYTGELIDFKYTGELPTGAESIVYIGDTSWSTLGQHSINYYFKGDINHNDTARSTINVTINPASYNIQIITSKVTYNGQHHKLVLTGDTDLIESVEWLYNGIPNQDNQGVIDAGVYHVTANITLVYGYSPTKNSYSALLTIDQKLVDLSRVTFNNRTVTYTGNPFSIYVTNGDTIEGVTGWNYTGNEQTDVKSDGSAYTVTATPVLNPNYKDDSEQPFTAELLINPASLGLVSFPDQTIDYDGTYHLIYISTTLPEQVHVIYSPAEGYMEVGEHEVTATFSQDKYNYILPSPMTAIMTITQYKFFIVSQTDRFVVKTDVDDEYANYKVL